MLATERLLEIEFLCSEQEVQRIVPLELDGEALRLILYLKDGTNLRITELWEGNTLRRYSYYWLTAENELKMGWDNAPHHTRLQSYPHHKHVERQQNVQASSETRLEDVMQVVIAESL